MASKPEGKDQVVQWVRETFPKGARCLDVGACNGIWFNLLGDYLAMDAVEIFPNYIEIYRLREKYWHVFTGDIADYQYDTYDLIIFGDVIEHMPVDKARKVLKYAYDRCTDMVVAVPFQYKQCAMNGNKWEKHIQDDLTPALFDTRYPGFQILYQPDDSYAYYIKKKRSD